MSKAKTMANNVAGKSARPIRMVYRIEVAVETNGKIEQIRAVDGVVMESDLEDTHVANLAIGAVEKVKDALSKSS